MIPFISICIPTYKRVKDLIRLLDSILIQNYSNFEVIISDDSDDDLVGNLVREYQRKLPISYFKSEIPLGTPSNWNFAISKAKGQWIKLVHDEDWFSNEGSLAAFAEAAQKNDNCFIFSSFTNVYFPEERTV